MRRIQLLLPIVMLALAPCTDAFAQVVVDDTHERLDSDRPEAWAMHYLTASTVMTGFGRTPALRPGQWAVAAELGSIPGLSREQQRVGLGGTKVEDLDKSPVFGRVRGWVGLPRGWVGEVGFTPPIEIGGARPRDLVAVAIGRVVFARGPFSLSARLFAQHGSVGGDITCPADVAATQDPEVNPYGCKAPSDDRLQLDDYGLELGAALDRGAWQWHASAAAVRTENEVQVDAYTFGIHDRTRLTSRDVLPAFAIGASHGFGKRWRWGTEALYVPLQVRREADGPSDNDPLTSLRVYLRYTAD